MNNHEKFLEALDTTLAEITLSASHDLSAYQTDKSGQASESPPLAVVLPETIEQVQALMVLASRYSIPVVPRGAGSGLAGGAIAGQGEVVVSLERLNKILDISPDDRLARVEAGVLNQRLNEAAQEQGLWFTPDPASRQWSTVGGNIATNAGGLLCAKYGVTRESVLEVAVVLADGRLVRMGHRSVKGVTGLDLCNLMVGSEGTLGIIVEATVKLAPVSPYPSWSVRADFASLESATDACATIMAEGITPAILELMDAVSYRHIADYLGEPCPAPPPTVLISQADGADGRETAHDIALLCERHGAGVEIVGDGEEAEELLRARRSMHPAMERVGNVLIEDVAVPRSQLRAMFESIRDIEAKFGIEIPTVAHAADGNLHPNLIYSGANIPPDIWMAADALFQRALELGGTLTGEHGVGVLKRKWLRTELGDDQWELQRQIKRVFDPQGLLNPGKVFSD